MDKDLESMAILRIQGASDMALKHYGTPLVVTYSGGKDSAVLLELFKRSGVPFEVQHSHTTADAPETVRFVREQFQKLEGGGITCKVDYPTYQGKPISMWSLIPIQKMPPTRLARYCCKVLKEHGGDGRYIATGVRWAESRNRENSRGIHEALAKSRDRSIILTNDNDEKRLLFESCVKNAKRVVNPIVDWEDKDVWDFIESEHIELNPLYSCGWSRVGCIGCPMAGTKGRRWQFTRYPKFEQNYIKAFERMLKVREQEGLPNNNWSNGKDVFHWWMEDGVLPGQIEMELDDVD